jgi:hypothetical protein
MVQLIQGGLKLCEWTIATTSKCATIGTVQESFRASHGTGFNPLARSLTLGQTSGNQADSHWQVDEEPLAFRQERAVVQITRTNRTGSI